MLVQYYVCNFSLCKLPSPAETCLLLLGWTLCTSCCWTQPILCRDLTNGHISPVLFRILCYRWIYWRFGALFFLKVNCYTNLPDRQTHVFTLTEQEHATNLLWLMPLWVIYRDAHHYSPREQCLGSDWPVCAVAFFFKAPSRDSPSSDRDTGPSCLSSWRQRSYERGRMMSLGSRMQTRSPHFSVCPAQGR